MASVYNAPDALTTHLQLIDIMVGIFVPATLASVWPNLDQEERAITFLISLLCSIPPIWWGSSITMTFGVKGPVRRALIHLYSYACFGAFIFVLPAFVIAAENFRHTNDISGFCYLAGFGMCAVLLLSIGMVEMARQRRVFELQFQREQELKKAQAANVAAMNTEQR